MAGNNDEVYYKKSTSTSWRPCTTTNSTVCSIDFCPFANSRAVCGRQTLGSTKNVEMLSAQRVDWSAPMLLLVAAPPKRLHLRLLPPRLQLSPRSLIRRQPGMVSVAPTVASAVKSAPSSGVPESRLIREIRVDSGGRSTCCLAGVAYRLAPLLTLSRSTGFSSTRLPKFVPESAMRRRHRTVVYVLTSRSKHSHQ